MGTQATKKTHHAAPVRCESNQARMTGANPLKAWTSMALKRLNAKPSLSLNVSASLDSSERERERSSHKRDRCTSVGECDPRYIVENMRFQGGVHHTQLLYAVFNGRPLGRSCYEMTFTWFRAKSGGEFEVIPGADSDWYQPSAEDIGAWILLQVEIDDTVLGCLETGPIVEDPTVRSRVENHLDDGTAFFTNVRLVPSSTLSSSNNAFEDVPQSPSSRCSWDACAQETWSLLIDDKRVRLSCESALIPPFEALYSPAVQMHLHASRSNALLLDFGPNDGVVHLHVDLHDRRDVIYLVFQAFSTAAKTSSALADAVSTGQSCMLTCRTLTSDTPAQSEVTYSLPWKRRQSEPATATPTELSATDDLVNSTLLHDVDALLQLSREYQADSYNNRTRT